jgi:hypothetical protein
VVLLFVVFFVVAMMSPREGRAGRLTRHAP